MSATTHTDDYAILMVSTIETVNALFAAGASIDTIDGSGYGLLKIKITAGVPVVFGGFVAQSGKPASSYYLVI
jgi:hypothetical protein